MRIGPDIQIKKAKKLKLIWNKIAGPSFEVKNERQKMIIKELITKENMHLEDAYKRLSEIKQLEVYSVDTLTTMEYIEDEIRCLEYLIAHLRSFALKMRSTS